MADRSAEPRSVAMPSMAHNHPGGDRVIGNPGESARQRMIQPSLSVSNDASADFAGGWVPGSA